MVKNYELEEDELIKVIDKDKLRIDVIYLTQKYIKTPTDRSKDKLNRISQKELHDLKEFIEIKLNIVKEKGIIHLLSYEPSYLLKDKSFNEYLEYTKTEEYTLLQEIIFPLYNKIKELCLSISIKNILNDENLIYYDVLIKSLNDSFKYMNYIKEKFKLDIKTINHFSEGLFRSITHTVDSIFYSERFIKLNENIEQITNELDTLLKKLVEIKNEDGSEGTKNLLRAEINKLEDELRNLSIEDSKKVIGHVETETIYGIDNENLKFKFEELKKTIKFRVNNINKEINHEEQIKYTKWIIHLDNHKSTDTLPFQDKFILDNMISPWSQELRELLGEDFYNGDFNVDEAIKYINKLRTNGGYSDTPQGKRHKTITLKNIFDLSDNEYTKADMLVLNKEILNTDYSTRTGLIIQSMRELGTEKNPVIKNHNGLTITKYGIPCSQKAIVLFNYLLGQFVENGASPTKILLNEEFYKGLNSSNGRGYNLQDIKNQLGAIAGQYIFIDDTKNKDIATKRINKSMKPESLKNIKDKGVNLMIVKYTEVEGQDAIEFTIPLMKMFCVHNQHARLINAKSIEHWSKNPRIPLITKELGKLSRNKSDNKLSIETLLKNIGEWDRYKSYSDKKKYFQRLNKDILKAIDYMETDKNFEYLGCTNGTFKEARITYK